MRRAWAVVVVGCARCAAMEPMSNSCPGVAYFHNPKTGGTGVEEYFHARAHCHVGRRGWAGVAAGARRPKGGWPCRSPWHLPPYLYGFLARAENATFTSLRDPLLRFVSELNHGWGSTAHFSGVEGEAFDFRHLGGRFADGTERRAAQLRLVDDLVDFYLGRDGYRPLGQRRVFAADCHLLPQYLYVGDARGGAVDRVLFTDRLDADALALLGELVPGVEAGCADPPCVREPVAARHVKKFAAEDLSNATVARVRDYYALDYALLNALRVSRGLAPYDDGAAHDYGAWAGQNATVAAVFAAFRRTALALPANATADDVRATMAPPGRRLRTR